MAKTKRYPEHEKLHQVAALSQACGEFVDWLESEKKIVFGQYHTHGPTCLGWDEDRKRVNYRSPGPHCEFRENELVPTIFNLKNALAEFFEIDQKKLEDEKLQLLEEQRQLNERGT